MKFNPIPLITICLLVSFCLNAQEDSRYRIQLQQESFIPSGSITPKEISSLNNKLKKINGKSFILIQFEQTSTEVERKQLQQSGIELLDYIPHYAYTATINGNLDAAVLQKAKARVVLELKPTQKMQYALSKGIFPAHAVKSPGSIDLWISFPKTFSLNEVVTELRNQSVDINSTIYSNYRILAIRISQQGLNELASLPIVEYVQPVPREDQALNVKSMASSRANVLVSSLGRNLNGDSVVVGVGDDSNPFRHIDFTNRIINRNIASGGAHGIHVMGTVGGAGLIDERVFGYAPRATIIAQSFSGVLNNIPAYVQDYGMVITNNSYANIADDCDNFGVYDLYSRILDQQAADFPNLQNVFAGGNSGGMNCAGYPAGFRNVLGGYQSAKNVISVGASNELLGIASFSSEGPVRDGRIKPEIMAQGAAVISAWPINIYSGNNGTSMAAPAVSGGLALLYQHYRRMHGGSNPKAGLMKAVLCNGGTDLGNPGPDYSYGYGLMNLLRSAIMLENNNYHINTITTGSNQNYNLVVPANTAQLRVMLYWNDAAASVLASQTLVNDLDLEVIDPSTNTRLPFILDTIPANVGSNATTGVDHVNNIEQVIVNNPPAGTYNLRVKGTAINQGPSQEYFLVFDTIPVQTVLTHPVGGEKLFPNDSIYISWESYGDPANNYTIEYTNNNGSTWSTVPGGTNVPFATKQLKWYAPSGTAADTTNQYKIRISRNGTGLVSTSGSFTVLGTTTISIAPESDQCEGYIKLNWTPVIDATDYEVMILQGEEFVSVDITNLTTYTIGGLSKDSTYWVTVRPRINGSPGRRGGAVSRQPNSGPCSGGISNNDIKVYSILSPAPAGRKFTSSELSNTNPVTIRIKNLDDISSSSSLDVSYYIDGVLQQTQTISPTIAGGATSDHTFSLNADFSSVGSKTLKVIVKKAGDPIAVNDTMQMLIRQLDNTALATGDLPWTDNFESAPKQEITGSRMGLEGRDRYDITTTTSFGRIRTFLNSGIAYSGSNALTLDMDRFNAGGNTDSLFATFNMSNFNAAIDNLRLDFRYKNHGQSNNAAHKVWIRGSETDSWIEVYDLFANQNEADGSYKLSAGIDISDSLTAHSQNYSTSFQVRWGQWGQFIAADNDGRDGYTFDDIRLYSVSDDIQVLRIDTPVAASCNLGNVVQVKAVIYNSANVTVNNIPIVLMVGNTIMATESITSIPAKTAGIYTFTTTVDLSAFGTQTVTVYTTLTSDTYKENDTARVEFTNSTVITSFPYLQDFETNNGSWYTGGKNSSWQYGTPASIKINKAASGTKAWKTTSTGFYNDKEFSYLYSPCFDVSGMTNPTLSFNVVLDLEDCGASLCDAAWVEYSTDGETWIKLGAVGSGTNWYNKNYSGTHLWSQQNYTRWHVATRALPTTNNSRLRLRFVMFSDQVVGREGIGVDDIHVYDNLNGIYTTTGTSPVVNQSTVNGNNWINFIESGTNKMIASINPNNQDLGSTNVQSFINTGGVRNYGGQYYHDRNITIKPTNNSLGGPATVRFYFLDSETEALIAATGCGACSKPTWFGELGVSKYSDPNDALEDGDVTNSLGPFWSFITAANVKKVPYDRGYYAEFSVTNFSELWLNDGWFDKDTPLPVELTSFVVNKTANRKDVLAVWKTATEINVNRFEIELAKGNDGLNQNLFVKIGEVAAVGNSTSEQTYSFLDLEMNKSGVRHYRLKIVDNDGTYTYSAIRPVLFSDEVKWQVYPNPSSSTFNLVYQLNAGETMEVKVHDASGRLVYQNRITGSGFVQKLPIEMAVSTGMYLLEATTDTRKETFRLIKK